MISEAAEPAWSWFPSLPPWTAAPRATHSSGLRFLDGSFPISCLTLSATAGILVEPPTNKTILMSVLERPASCSAFSTGVIVLSTRSAVSSLNVCLDRVISMWWGPSLAMAIKGRLILVVTEEDSSFFAFSASSLKRCIAEASFERLIPSLILNCSTR